MGRIVDLVFDDLEDLWREVLEVCVEGQVSSQPSIDVLDAALLPGTMRVAEEGFEGEGCVEFVMMCELYTVVLGQSSAHGFGHGFEPEIEVCCDAVCGAICLLDDVDEARCSFLCDEDV